MNKVIMVLAIAISVIACQKQTETTKAVELKTAYVDTSKMMEDYAEAKDVNDKYDAKLKEAQSKFKVEEDNLAAEAANFRKTAQANGQAWAQQKAGELQQKGEYLRYAEQQSAQQIQQAHAAEMDTIVKTVKKYIKDYGKEKGYAYIYGTGDAATVLYAEDKYDITKEITDLLNEKYKGAPKKEEAPATTEKKK